MKTKKILIIRFRRVGDAVLSTVLCTSLRRSFPEAQIDYVLNEGIASLFEGHPDVDNVITFTEKENKNILLYTRKVWQIVRNGRYDVIIDVRSTVKTLFFPLFSPSTPYRIGTKKQYNYFLHNYRVDNRSDSSENVILRLLKLLEPLEAIGNIQYCKEFTLALPDAEIADFRQKMSAFGIDFARPVIIAAVTARLAHKVWEKDRMKEILHRIIEKYQAQIIFNYGNAEEVFAKALHHDMHDDPNIFTNIKASSLRELAAMMINADFFFGNEGGPRHISQALGLPSYAIFPPGISKTLWLPMTEEQKCLGISPDDVCSRKEQKIMSYKQRFDLITVEQVWQGVDSMLQRYLGNKVH